MEVTIGKLVHYKLDADDCTLIEAMRSTMEAEFSIPSAMQGEDVSEGEIYPAVVVKVQSGAEVSLQVALPGTPGAVYLRNKGQGLEQGSWCWPELSEAGPYREQLQHFTQSAQRQASRA